MAYADQHSSIVLGRHSLRRGRAVESRYQSRREVFGIEADVVDRNSSPILAIHPTVCSKSNPEENTVKLEGGENPAAVEEVSGLCACHESGQLAGYQLVAIEDRNRGCPVASELNRVNNSSLPERPGNFGTRGSTYHRHAWLELVGL